MKKNVRICILLGITLLVIATIFYMYKTSSTGMLQYIDYPLRSYAVLLLALGVISFISGIILNFHSETND